MASHDIFFWTVLVAISLLIGISKSGLPGVGILAIVWLPTVMPARESTGLILPMLIAGDIFAVATIGRHAVWRHLWKMLPCAVVGVVIGYLLLARVNDRQLRPIIAIIILAMLAMGAWRNRKSAKETPIPEGWWFAAPMGLAGGITTMLANAAGPVMIVYFLAMRLPKEEFVGTAAWFFLLVNTFKVPFSAHLGLITPESVKLNLILVPAILLGGLLGLKLLKRIPEKGFNLIVQLFALLGALKLLLPG